MTFDKPEAAEQAILDHNGTVVQGIQLKVGAIGFEGKQTARREALSSVFRCRWPGDNQLSSRLTMRLRRQRGRLSPPATARREVTTTSAISSRTKRTSSRLSIKRTSYRSGNRLLPVPSHFEYHLRSRSRTYVGFILYPCSSYPHVLLRAWIF